MALKPFYKSETEIPQELRSHYGEKPDAEGRFVLAIDSNGAPGWGLEDVGALKSALGKFTDQSRVLRDAFAKMGVVIGRDVDAEEAEKRIGTLPEEIKGLRTKVAELSAIDPEKEADKLAEKKAAERVEQLKEQARKEKEALEAKLGSKDARLYKLAVENEATQALIDAGAEPAAIPLLLGRVREITRVREDEKNPEDLVKEVLDRPGGTPRIKDAQGTLFGLKDLASELRETMPFCFKGSGKSGGDAQQKTVTTTVVTAGKLTPEQAGQLPLDDYKKARAEGRIG